MEYVLVGIAILWILTALIRTIAKCLSHMLLFCAVLWALFVGGCGSATATLKLYEGPEQSQDSVAVIRNEIGVGHFEEGAGGRYVRRVGQKKVRLSPHGIPTIFGWPSTVSAVAVEPGEYELAVEVLKSNYIPGTGAPTLYSEPLTVLKVRVAGGHTYVVKEVSQWVQGELVVRLVVEDTLTGEIVSDNCPK